MRRTNVTLLLAGFVITTCLWAQGRVGGTRGGSGVQGGLGSAPSALGGSAGRVGSGMRISGAGGPGVSVHPQGYIGQAGSGVSIVESSQTFGAAGAASTRIRPGAGRFGVRSGVIMTPRSQSVPSLDSSIPPLEQGPAGQRAAAARRESAIFDFNRTQGRFLRRGGFSHAVPVVVVPYAYGGYAYAANDPNVIVIERNTQISSSAEHVVTVDPQRTPPAKPAAEAKVIEVKPGEPENTAEVPQGDVQVLRGGSPQQLGERPAFYLVAMKSGVIYTSREHWLEGETLHYITVKGAHQTEPLSKVDLDFTRQLNAERNMPFVLEVRPVSAPGR